MEMKKQNNIKAKNKSNRNQALQIPKTGKIGRFANNIKKETNPAIFQKVMEGIKEFESTTDKAEKAKWIREAIERLETSAGKEKSVRIMEKCGRECFNQHQLAKQLKEKPKSIKEIIGRLNKGSVALKMKDKNTIIAEYYMCFCHIVKQTKEPFPTDTYCCCSVGWWKQLFESALKKPVKVELVHSIISGAKTCKFIVHILTNKS